MNETTNHSQTENEEEFSREDLARQLGVAVNEDGSFDPDEFAYTCLHMSRNPAYIKADQKDSAQMVRRVRITLREISLKNRQKIK